MASSLPSPFTTIEQTFVRPILDYVDTAVANTAGLISGPLTAALTLYVVVFGWQLMSGRMQAPLADIAQRSIKIGVILALVLGGSNGLYASLVKTPLLTTIPNEISQMVSGKTFQDNESGFDGIVAAAGKASDQIWDSVGYGSVTGAMKAGFATFMLTVVGYATATVGFTYAMYAKLAVGLLLGLGPIFIAFAMFDATRRFFDGWLSQVANFVILQVLIAASQLVMVSAVTTCLNAPMTLASGGVIASAIVTCLVMMGFFSQLPTIAHALVQGGTSLGFNLAGAAAASRWASTTTGDYISRNVHAAHVAHRDFARTNVAPTVTQRTWARLKDQSRGGFRDHRQYAGARGVRTSDAQSSHPGLGTPGSDRFEQLSSEKR